MTLTEHDRLVTWVYLDPARPPREIMIEWIAGTRVGASRLLGTEDAIGSAAGAAPSPLDGPAAGERRLGAARSAGRRSRYHGEATPVTGWSFVQVGGVALWDAAAVVPPADSPSTAAFGDLLWALLAGPEFAFIQ